MNITTALRNVTDYHLALSEQDAISCVADPAAFGEMLAAQLRELGVAAAPSHSRNGGGTPGPKDDAGAPAQSRRQPRPRARKLSLTRLNKRPPKPATLKCPECGRLFRTAGRLTNHRRDRHGVGSAQPPATATAATAA